MKDRPFLEVLEVLANKFDGDGVEVTFDRDGLCVIGGDDDPHERETCYVHRQYEATFQRDDDDKITNDPVQEILDAIDRDDAKEAEDK